ncbi:MAG: YicC family protein [bacterium]|nr:YicC family protein [bacterium]
MLEARSVNGKHLSVKFRLPSSLSAFEQRLTNLVQGNVDRGSVTLTCLEFSGFADPGAVPKVNLDLARGYIKAATSLPPEVSRDLTAYELLRLPGVVAEFEGRLDAGRLGRALDATAGDALRGLADSRRREGEELSNKIGAMLDSLAGDLSTLRSLADAVPERIKVVLFERLSELTGTTLDRERLEQEVAYLASRADVTEELDRLEGHIGAFRSALDSTESQGRRLDFLCQEVLRELNTCGSKASGTDITPLVLDMKVTLDRIREQAANIA